MKIPKTNIFFAPPIILGLWIKRVNGNSCWLGLIYLLKLEHRQCSVILNFITLWNKGKKPQTLIDQIRFSTGEKLKTHFPVELKQQEMAFFSVCAVLWWLQKKARKIVNYFGLNFRRSIWFDFCCFFHSPAALLLADISTTISLVIFHIPAWHSLSKETSVNIAFPVNF